MFYQLKSSYDFMDYNLVALVQNNIFFLMFLQQQNLFLWSKCTYTPTLYLQDLHLSILFNFLFMSFSLSWYLLKFYYTRKNLQILHFLILFLLDFLRNEDLLFIDLLSYRIKYHLKPSQYYCYLSKELKDVSSKLNSNNVQQNRYSFLFLV